MMGYGLAGLSTGRSGWTDTSIYHDQRGEYLLPNSAGNAGKTLR
jgi:hypothetical protein